MEVNIWVMLLYGVIAVLALKSLFTLMQQHKKLHLYLLGKKAKKKAELQREQLEAEQEPSESDNQETRAA